MRLLHQPIEHPQDNRVQPPLSVNVSPQPELPEDQTTHRPNQQQKVCIKQPPQLVRQANLLDLHEKPIQGPLHVHRIIDRNKHHRTTTNLNHPFIILHQVSKTYPHTTLQHRTAGLIEQPHHQQRTRLHRVLPRRLPAQRLPLRLQTHLEGQGSHRTQQRHEDSQHHNGPPQPKENAGRTLQRKRLQTVPHP